MFSSLMNRGSSPTKSDSETKDGSVSPPSDDENDEGEIESNNTQKTKAPTQVIVPPVRLNPKLTQRRQIRPGAPSYLLAGPSEEDSDDYDYDDESSEDDDYDPDNYETPRTENSEELKKKAKKVARKEKHHHHAATATATSGISTGASLSELRQLGNTRLKHNGHFIPKVFKVGRSVPLTGIWDCCGNTLPLSLYCEGKDARKVMKKTFEASLRSNIELKEYYEQKRSSAAGKVEWEKKAGTQGTYENTLCAEDVAS